ncbi:hypothetical protein M8J75_008342 [Diaphorina citri]|nr:hypothetical protein M8J75_008342 [Diaphorina citri]KAI5707514.1 hypothetical protein M8J77_004216 [Diaphorina citri]
MNGIELDKYDVEELSPPPPQQQPLPVATATPSIVFVPSTAYCPPPAQQKSSKKNKKTTKSNRNVAGGKVRSARVPVLPKTINQRSAYFWVDNASESVLRRYVCKRHCDADAAEYYTKDNRQLFRSCTDINFLEPVNGNQVVFKNSCATMPSNWFGSLKNQAFSAKNRLPVVGVANVLPTANITNDLLMLMRLRTVFNGLAESIKMKASKLSVLACTSDHDGERGGNCA